MMEMQRQAYLEAMGIVAWVSKHTIPDTERWMIGPGSGSTLLLCRTAQESASRLAVDIGRSLGGDPVWAWPDPGGSKQFPSLTEAIEQNLFIQVIVFGQVLASQAFNGDVPEVLGSASVQLAPDLNELAVDGAAKRKLWQCLSNVLPDND